MTQTALAVCEEGCEDGLADAFGVESYLVRGRGVISKGLGRGGEGGSRVFVSSCWWCRRCLCEVVVVT